jgi:hypothetical protein
MNGHEQRRWLIVFVPGNLPSESLPCCLDLKQLRSTDLYQLHRASGLDDRREALAVPLAKECRGERCYRNKSKGCSLRSWLRNS